MPRYMLMFVGSDEDLEAMPKDKRDSAYADVGRWWGDLSAKGIIKEGEQLAPGRTATTVRRVNGKMQVSDGPFIEAKESVGGYALVEVPDLDAAIALAKSWPAGDVEVRPTVEH
jgi:hypothetical protein